jgi:uncharacterized Tic20 family protein
MNTTSTTYLALPPSSLRKADKLAALVAHAGTVFAWFLAPLVVYLVKKDDSKWVAYHAMQSLLWSLAGTVLGVLTGGIAVFVFLGFHLWAAWRIHKDGDYEYPLIGRAAREVVYG